MKKNVIVFISIAINVSATPLKGSIISAMGSVGASQAPGFQLSVTIYVSVLGNMGFSFTFSSFPYSLEWCIMMDFGPIQDIFLPLLWSWYILMTMLRRVKFLL